MYRDRIASAANQDEIDALLKEAKQALLNAETEVIGSENPTLWTAVTSSVWTRDADKGELFSGDFAIDGIIRTRDDLRTYSSDIEDDPYLSIDLGEERRIVSVIIYLRRPGRGYHDQDYYKKRFVNYEITLSRFEYDEILCGRSGSDPPNSREFVEITCDIPTVARVVTIMKKGNDTILDANEVKIRAYPLEEGSTKLQAIDASYEPRVALRSAVNDVRNNLNLLDRFQGSRGRDRMTVNAVTHCAYHLYTLLTG